MARTPSDAHAGSAVTGARSPWRSAQSMCSRTSSLALSRRAASARAISASPVAASALPSATARLRCQRSKLMRRIALPSVVRRKVSSSHAQSASSPGASSAGRTSKSASGLRGRELVPRADELAVVAAVDAVADRGAEFDRDRAVRFDRQVRDAAARVERVRRDDRLRRADVDARAAAAAVRADRRRLGQSEIDEDLAEEEHRAAFAVEGERVLAAPADAAPGRELDLQHRRGIGEDAVAERADRLGEPVGELAQALAQHLVVVAAARVDRDRRRGRLAEAAPFDFLPARLGRARQVVEPRRDHAQGSGDELGGPRPLHSMRRHVLHLAVKAVLDPCGEAGLCRAKIDSGDADLGKSERASPRPQLLEQGRAVEEEVGPLVSSPPSILETRFAAWPDEAACAATAGTIAAHDALHDAFIELHGPLGAGKTTFVRHLLHGLGVAGTIRSPTYTLMEPYRAGTDAGGFEIAHCDFYRFDDPAEWEDAGFRDVFAAPGLKLVEWPEKPPASCRGATCASRSRRTTAATARAARFEALSEVGRELLP